MTFPHTEWHPTRSAHSHGIMFSDLRTGKFWQKPVEGFYSRNICLSLPYGHELNLGDTWGKRRSDQLMHHKGIDGNDHWNKSNWVNLFIYKFFRDKTYSGCVSILKNFFHCSCAVNWMAAYGIMRAIVAEFPLHSARKPSFL